MASGSFGASRVEPRAEATTDRARVESQAHTALTQLTLRARGDGQARLAARLAIPALPSPNRVAVTSQGECLWLGPDEWLLVASAAERNRLMADLESALGAVDGAVVDVSAARVPLVLTGPSARDVMASCCPIDLSARVFHAGHCAQSLIGKAPVLFHQVDDRPTYRLLVRPSYVDYVVRWLTDGIAGLG